MKPAINLRKYDVLLVLGFALFFAVGTANAQSRQQARDCTRFAQCDLNGDGFIGQNEFRNGNLSGFDKDGDGLLSRKEYRTMNKSQKADKGQGQGRQMKGQGNGQGQRVNAKGGCDGQGPGLQKGYRQGSGQGMRGQGRASGRGRG
ncbi:MAG: hypothetical protein KDD19_17835 [Phaeodactylibacter sp.]|nr:hypothetical protein [Phaeodactylibacter sp.]MCB9050857.1 hypothetical protein [Lewinellaceae bacterium]